MIPLLPYLNSIAVVKRRSGGASGDGATRDAFNAQVYGPVTSWDTVYEDMPCRLEVKTKPIAFTPAGERTNPDTNVLYISSEYELQTEDRIIIGNITYIAQGIMSAYNPSGGIHHYEVEVIIEP